MSDALLSDYEWLLSPAAEASLVQAAELLRSGKSLVQCVQTLRREHSAARAHLILETIDLRQRAAEKFSQAERMFFTRRGYEQATDEQIAAYKAERFPAGQPVADWCCGIGGDLAALATRGEWCGVDRDPVMRLLAAWNVAAGNEFGRLQPEISVDQIPPDGAWHLDPDRRASGGRSTKLEAFSPPLEFIAALLNQRPHGALKIAPASEVPAEWLPSAEREWISRGGECRQQVVWFGQLARFPGEHSATIVSSRGVSTIHGSPTTEVPIADQIGGYLHEPDAAVLAAKLTGVLAVQHQLAAIAPGSVYLTSDAPADHPAVTSFRIREQLPFDVKQLKHYLRERGIGRLEIKKRGVDVSPEQLRKSLSIAGDNSLTLFVTRLGKKTIAIVAER